MGPDDPVTGLLNTWGTGDHRALDRALEQLYGELRRRAASAMRGERPDHTLSPTALLNETYLRLRQMRCSSWSSRAKFLDFASRVMQRLLVEHARARRAAKRGGDQERLDVDPDTLAAQQPAAIDLLDLAEALERLRSIDLRLARIVELRYLAGATEEETAEVLGVARATVQRDWAVAKRWLARELLP